MFLHLRGVGEVVKLRLYYSNGTMHLIGSLGRSSTDGKACLPSASFLERESPDDARGLGCDTG